MSFTAAADSSIGRTDRRSITVLFEGARFPSPWLLPQRLNHRGENSDPRVYFAAERTFLAWIRTGLALMGFGFVVARFGIFLQQLVLDRGDLPMRSSGVSAVLGVLLLATGVVVCLAATWRHVILVRTLKRGEALDIRPSALAIALALALAVVGVLMTIYLLRAANVTWPSNQKGPSMQTQNDSGVITRLGTYSVEETVVKLRALLEQRNITLFTLIDHSGEAAKVGMNMPPTKLLIFGNPKGGTPVMLAAPTSAIDLPLKLLVWQYTDGKTRLSYNDPDIFRIAIISPPSSFRT